MEFTHTANPVRVNARQITKVLELGYLLDDGSEYHPPFGSEARYSPVAGDYVVTQEDGYQYFNPKDVFERKYSAIPKPVVNVYSDVACVFQYCPTPNICQRGGGCINAGAAKA